MKPLPPLPETLTARGIALRREAPGDRAFAGKLYAENRIAEFALMPWPPAAKAAFLAQQFDAQGAHFRAAHPKADRWIVEQDGAPIGRLYLDRAAVPWSLVEIGLSDRGRGTGTALIGWLQSAAPSLALHVAHDNPRAAALYVRLGFVY